MGVIIPTCRFAAVTRQILLKTFHLEIPQAAIVWVLIILHDFITKLFAKLCQSLHAIV